jgi:hypothetical protein
MMKVRTLLATAVAASAAIAAGAISSTASAYPAGCSDSGYLRGSMPAATHGKRSVVAEKNGSYWTAAAEELVAWRTVLNAPVPCSNYLRRDRTYELRGHSDYYRAEKAFAAGNFDAGNALNTLGLHEFDLANAALVEYGG